MTTGTRDWHADPELLSRYLTGALNALTASLPETSRGSFTWSPTPHHSKTEAGWISELSPCRSGIAPRPLPSLAILADPCLAW